jgi:hypothetical protein
MAITKICIIGLEDYAMLTGDSSYGYIGGESGAAAYCSRGPGAIWVWMFRSSCSDSRSTARDHRGWHSRRRGVIAMDEGIRMVRFLPSAVEQRTSVPCGRVGAERLLSIAGRFLVGSSGSGSRSRSASARSCASQGTMSCRRGQQPMRHRRDRGCSTTPSATPPYWRRRPRNSARCSSHNYGVNSEILDIAVDAANPSRGAKQGTSCVVGG